MDEERRKTLLTLIDLAADHSPTVCWDDQRAMQLLRSQATEDELRELHAPEELIEHIFGSDKHG